jgi:type I restriction enzyme M protein
VTEQWWRLARDDFAKLEHDNNLPKVRGELLATFKERLVPIGVLDEFQTAGVFVNWWQNIRYDLKTIVSIGWHQVLIPDEYLIEAFFQEEAKHIQDLEAKINEAQDELAQTVEAVDYEPEEDETVTAPVIKKYLKAVIDDLKDSTGASAEKERKAYKGQFDAIKKQEDKISKLKKDLKEKQSNTNSCSPI